MAFLENPNGCDLNRPRCTFNKFDSFLMHGCVRWAVMLDNYMGMLRNEIVLSVYSKKRMLM